MNIFGQTPSGDCIGETPSDGFKGDIPIGGFKHTHTCCYFGTMPTSD